METRFGARDTVWPVPICRCACRGPFCKAGQKGSLGKRRTEQPASRGNAEAAAHLLVDGQHVFDEAAVHLRSRQQQRQPRLSPLLVTRSPQLSLFCSTAQAQPSGTPLRHCCSATTALPLGNSRSICHSAADPHTHTNIGCLLGTLHQQHCLATPARPGTPSTKQHSTRTHASTPSRPQLLKQAFPSPHESPPARPLAPPPSASASRPCPPGASRHTRCLRHSQ